MRKPRLKNVGDVKIECWPDNYITLNYAVLGFEEARVIAAALLKAADWLEEKEGEK